MLVWLASVNFPNGVKKGLPAVAGSYAVVATCCHIGPDVYLAGPPGGGISAGSISGTYPVQRSTVCSDCQLPIGNILEAGTCEECRRLFCEDCIESCRFCGEDACNAHSPHWRCMTGRAEYRTQILSCPTQAFGLRTCSRRSLQSSQCMNLQLLRAILLLWLKNMQLCLPLVHVFCSHRGVLEEVHLS